MKTLNNPAKPFDTVKAFREIKTRISHDIQGMSFAELKAYLAKHSLKSRA